MNAELRRHSAGAFLFDKSLLTKRPHYGCTPFKTLMLVRLAQDHQVGERARGEPPLCRVCRHAGDQALQGVMHTRFPPDRSQTGCLGAIHTGTRRAARRPRHCAGCRTCTRRRNRRGDTPRSPPLPRHCAVRSDLHSRPILEAPPRRRHLAERRASVTRWTRCLPAVIPPGGQPTSYAHPQPVGQVGTGRPEPPAARTCRQADSNALNRDISWSRDLRTCASALKERMHSRLAPVAQGKRRPPAGSDG